MNDLQKIDKKIKDSSNNISAMCKFIKYANVVSPTIFAVLVLVLTFNYNLLDIPFVKTHPIIAKIIFILIIAFCAFMIIISILYFFVSKEEDIFIGELNEKRNLLTKNQELGKVRIENGKQDYGTVVLANDATELLKVTDSESEYTFNIKVNKKI